MDDTIQPLTGAPGISRLYWLAAAAAVAGIVALVDRARRVTCPCGGCDATEKA